MKVMDVDISDVDVVEEQWTKAKASFEQQKTREQEKNWFWL